MHRSDIFVAIGDERERQDRFHPSFGEMSPAMKLAVLIEEVGEVATEVQMAQDGLLKDELIQVAAVAIRWLEGID